MKRTEFISLLISTFILLIPAFYNQYPLVYSDTGTYIHSGLTTTIPADRPIFYGLLIRLLSIKISLWPVIFFQAFSLAYCMKQFFHFLKKDTNSLSYWTFLCLTSIFTGMGWYTSQVMPDVFTPIAILSVLILLLKQEIPIIEKSVLSVLFCISLVVHFSNIFIIILVLIFVFTLSKFNNKRVHISFKKPILLLTCALTLIYTTNFILDHNFQFSKGGHIFITGRILDASLLKQFLDEECDENNYVLCPYKDSLPIDSRKFLWSSSSPLNKTGGWVDSEKEYNKMLLGFVSNPKFLILFGYNAILSSVSQVFQNDVGSGIDCNYGENSPPLSQIKTYYPNELNPFKQSRQNTNLWGQDLSFNNINLINFILTISSIFIILKVFREKQVSDEAKLAILILLLGILSNAIITASLANIYDRLQARVNWLIVLAAFSILKGNINKVLLIEKK